MDTLMGQKIREIVSGCMIVIILAGCTHCAVGAKNEGNNAELNTGKMKNAELIVQVKMEFSGTVGYGNTYDCQIEKTERGSLDQDKFMLVVMVGDSLEQFVQQHLSPEVVRIGFHKKQKNVPYQTMPLTGFVDNDRTSWEVVRME